MDLSTNKNRKYEYGCKLPASYGQGVYEERPDWVADQQVPTLRKEEGEYEWGDPEIVKQDGDVKAKTAQYCSLVKAGGNNFYLGPGETLEQCPYDKHHHILTPRFAQHLTKCRRNYVKTQKSRGAVIGIKICPHNSLHHVPAESMSEHAKMCDATIQHIELQEQLKRLPKAKGTLTNDIPKHVATKQAHCGRKQVKHEIHKPDENWELEPAAKPFNPVERLAEEGTCFIVPHGMTRSERKDFRQNESRRSSLIRERNIIVAQKEYRDREEPCSSAQAKQDDEEFLIWRTMIDEEIEERTQIFKEYMYRTRPSDDWWYEQNEEEEPPYKKPFMANGFKKNRLWK